MYAISSVQFPHSLWVWFTDSGALPLKNAFHRFVLVLVRKVEIVCSETQSDHLKGLSVHGDIINSFG